MIHMEEEGEESKSDAEYPLFFFFLTNFLAFEIWIANLEWANLVTLQQSERPYLLLFSFFPSFFHRRCLLECKDEGAELRPSWAESGMSQNYEVLEDDPRRLDMVWPSRSRVQIQHVLRSQTSLTSATIEYDDCTQLLHLKLFNSGIWGSSIWNDEF